jgi:EAL domain-containing protein (putative c-di-GMP-specific phosphodiesterase class I)
VLEVTETVFSVDRPVALEVLSRLRSIGVRISIDDFGTGYSSLSVLRDLPVDELKIDRSFVSTLTSGGDSSLVETIIRLSHDFDLSTVAEGIEVAEQLDVLRRLGCDVGQGYLLGRPGPAHAIGDLIADAAERSSEAAVGSV